MTDTTIRCRWAGGVLSPVGNYAMARACDLMAEGDSVFVTIEHPRSDATHKHQFATIKDAWETLPESLQDAPWAATPETLRKHALCVTGFCNSYVIDCGSKAAAERVAGPLRAAEVGRHGYAIVSVRGPVVAVWTPQSQSARAMGGKEFQRSKEAVLNWITQQIEGAVDADP
jgi:hypothetical protein